MTKTKITGELNFNKHRMFWIIFPDEELEKLAKRMIGFPITRFQKVVGHITHAYVSNGYIQWVAEVEVNE